MDTAHGIGRIQAIHSHLHAPWCAERRGFLDDTVVVSVLAGTGAGVVKGVEGVVVGYLQGGFKLSKVRTRVHRVGLS